MEPYIEPNAICKTKVNINYYEYFNTLKYKIKIIIEIFTAIPTTFFRETLRIGWLSRWFKGGNLDGYRSIITGIC